MTLTEIDYNGTTKTTKTKSDKKYANSYNISNILSPTFETDTINKYSGWSLTGWTTSTSPTTEDILIHTSDITISEDTTLYAVYEQNIILTEIDYNGTTKDTRTKSDLRKVNSYNINNISNPTFTTDTIRTYTGWTTRGWSTSTSANASVTVNSGANITLSENTTLYALYNRTLTLTEVDYNGTTKENRTKTGTQYTNSYSIVSTANPTITSDAVRTYTGWTTRGWSKNSNPNANVHYNANSSIVLKDDLTIYAVYERTLTATFIDYSSTKQTRTYTGTQYVNSYDNTSFENPIVEAPEGNNYPGWRWKGWSAKDATGNTISPTYNEYDDIVFSSSFTCYGLYSRIITLTYNAEGGDSTPAQETFTQETNSYNINNVSKKKLNLSLSINKEGFNFKGWGENSISGTRYDANAEYTLSAITTMHAVWERNKYTVTYNYTENGGTATTAPSTSSVLFEGAIDLTPTATKNGDTGIYSSSNHDGWQFIGWNTDKDATEGLSEMTMPAKNVTLYAIFKKTLTVNEVQIKDSEKETVSKQYVLYNKATTASHLLNKNPEKCLVDIISSTQAQWSAIGWTTNTSGKTGLVNLDATIQTTTDITYYAVYERDLIVNFVDAKGISKNTTTLTEKQLLNSSTTNNFVSPTFNAPSANTFTYNSANGAWTFSGWTKSSNTNATNLLAVNASVKNDSNNVTYYAIYERTLKTNFVDYKNNVKTTTTLSSGQKVNASNLSNISSNSITVPQVSAFNGWNAEQWSKSTTSFDIALQAGNVIKPKSNETYYAIYNRDISIYFYEAEDTSIETLKQQANANDIEGTKTQVTIEAPTIYEYVDSSGNVWEGQYWSLSTNKDAIKNLDVYESITTKEDLKYYAEYKTRFKTNFVSINGISTSKQYVYCDIFANASDMSSTTTNTIVAPTPATNRYDNLSWTALGWNKSKTTQTPGITVGGNITVSTNNETYYGIYSSSYEATFIDYNKTAKRTRKVNVSNTMNAGDFVINTLTANAPAIGIYNDGITNWVISGWAVADNPKADVIVESEKSFTIDKNTTFYAVYTNNVKVNMVDFVSNATSNVEKQAIAYVNSCDINNKSAAEFTIPAQNGYTQNGKAFNPIGWAITSTTVDSSGVKYYSSQTLYTNNNITIYAMYSKDITITYNGNGGTNPSSTTGMKIVNASGASKNPDITITTVIPSRTGFTFANKWLTGISTGTEYLTGSTYSINDDVMLYAQWTLDTVDMTATINWEDNSNILDSRPDNIYLSVYRDGQKISSHIVSTLDGTFYAPVTDRIIPSEGLKITVDKTTNKMTYEFPGLQKYNPETGSKYTYTLVQEPFISKIDTVKYTVVSSGDSWTINNIIKDLGNKTIMGNIYWHDDSNTWHLRPKSVVVTLYKKDPTSGTTTKQEKTITVGANDSISYYFNGQKELNGQNKPYEYTVGISDIMLYSSNNINYDFDLTLTTLPGGFTGGDGNELIISADAFNWEGAAAKGDDYSATATNEKMSVLVTLKTIAKEWKGSGSNKYEDWGDNNTYFTDIEENVVEYNVLVTPEKNTQVDYLPDGRYEVVVHDSSLFDLKKFEASVSELNNATLTTDGNGRYFITFESRFDSSSIKNLHAQVILKGWRGYSSLKETMYKPVHMFGNELIYGDIATCQKEGLKYHVCMICGERSTENVEIVPKTPHNYVNKVCQYCGDVQK